jgi:hypothetical protein
MVRVEFQPGCRNETMVGNFVCFVSGDLGPLAIIETDDGCVYDAHLSRIRIIEKKPSERKTVLD